MTKDSPPIRVPENEPIEPKIFVRDAVNVSELFAGEVPSPSVTSDADTEPIPIHQKEPTNNLTGFVWINGQVYFMP